MSDKGPRLQLIWWWRMSDWQFGFWRVNGSLRCVYAWLFGIGPLEVRRWERRSITELRREGIVS